MFKIDFLGSTAKHAEIREETNAGVMAFSKKIDWLKQVKDYFSAYRGCGDDDLSFNDHWCLLVTNLKDKSNLMIFTEDIDEGMITADNLCFVVVYSWSELHEKGWLGKLLSNNEMKMVDLVRHLPGGTHKIMLAAINEFVNEDVSRLKAIVNYEGDPYDHT